MDDRQRLEEHALGRRRLVASMLHGSGWRERRQRGTVRPILGGLVLAALLAVGLGVATYIGDQLEAQRAQRRGQNPVGAPAGQTWPGSGVPIPGGPQSNSTAHG